MGERKAKIADEKQERRKKEREKKIQGKQYVDKKRRAKDNGIQPGDQVLLKVDKTNKLSSNFCLGPGCREKEGSRDDTVK